ncbi:head decoration protein [Paraburkholderia sp. A2WS-5]|uniref:head decoration protein n=1 Tax=unclassified Paraburkholderia TaxID=2615204 RepID=UPI003B77F799
MIESSFRRCQKKDAGAHLRLSANPDWQYLRRFNKRFDATWADEFRKAVEALWRGYSEDMGRYNDVSRQLTVPTQIGVYSLVFTSATAFTVTAPSGATANGTTGVAFSALGIGFTITAGGTAFVAGDSFAITTTAAVGKPTAAAVAGGTNTGNGTCSAVTTTGYAPTLGAYAVEFDDATHFIVSAPNGQEIGHGVAGTAFSGGGLNFTITAGGTAFVPGDSFTVTVAAGTGKWVACTSTAVDGSQNAAGICFGVTDASLNDTYGAIVMRQCEVNISELVWDPSMTAANQAAALVLLQAQGIIGR